MTILLSKKKEFSIFGNTRHKIGNKKLQIERKWDGIFANRQCRFLFI